MIYLNEKEEKTIGRFFAVEEKYVGEILALIWSNGSQAVAKYDSYIEDENDCEMEENDYEEFTSFIFSNVNTVGNPPIDVTEDGFFCISYQNFPKDILYHGEKIN